MDGVIANNSLEHLYEPAVARREVAGVLAPDGRLFALIPLDELNPDSVLPAESCPSCRGIVAKLEASRAV